MRNESYQFLVAGFLVALMTGCTSMSDKYPGCNQLTVVVTSDQNFVVGNEKVTVNEFFDKAIFDKEIHDVMFVRVAEKKYPKR